MSLHEYYNSSRYENIEKPYRDGSISKEEVKKLLSDLLYQFNTEIHTVFGLEPPEKKDLNVVEPKDIKKEEKESSSNLPAYGLTNIYPYKGSGAGLPSSKDLDKLSDEIPTRKVKPL